MTKRIYLEDGEMEGAMVIPGMVVHCSFGPRGAWVDFDDEEPLTPFVRYLLLSRGILNENLSGAGI